MKQYSAEDSPYTAPPIQGDRHREVGKSSPSWSSDYLQGVLIASMSQPTAVALPFHSSSSSGSRPDKKSAKSRCMPQPNSNSSPQRKTQQQPSLFVGEGLQRDGTFASRTVSARESTDSAILEDDDAGLAMDSLNANQKLSRQSKNLGAYKDSDDEVDNPAASLIQDPYYPSPNAASSPQQISHCATRQLSPTQLFDSSDQDFSAIPWRQESTETTPRAQKRELRHQEERSLFDTSPQLTGRSIPPIDTQVQSLPRIETQNKVMTPAQFEQYRKEQESRREQYFNHDASDEEGDDYEDVDEIERHKQLARQRRKQEAHLSVYRQQMMKVTGEQPSDLPSVQLRPGMDRLGMSAPNLTDRSSTPTFSFDKPSDPAKASDDEDEDVPLGVLAAHGFPSKSKPPNALNNSSASIQYKSESYPPPPLSIAGPSVAGAARGLPPFARNLPPDPYYGAGLVNASNRESLALGHGAPASVQGGPQPSMAPGGLVGVIAGEERARAARRGSPNAQGSYSSPLPPGMSQMQMGMLLGTPPMMSPGEQATVQMSEQMSQMMQMQMQWMQQMQQIMASGMQTGPQMPSAFPLQQPQLMNAGMVALPDNPQRSVFTGPHSAPGTPVQTQEKQQRAMSMMGPTSAAGWQPQNNNRSSALPSMMSGALGGPGSSYTASIAPSERSNIGMPSRYRPVSTAPGDEHVQGAASRTSTLKSGMLQPGAVSNRNSRLSTPGDRQSTASLRPISQTPPKNPTASDDDDEEGWEEMKKKRERKKSMWRMKKTRDDSALDLYEYHNA